MCKKSTDEVFSNVDREFLFQNLEQNKNMFSMSKETIKRIYGEEIPDSKFSETLYLQLSMKFLYCPQFHKYMVSALNHKYEK